MEHRVAATERGSGECKCSKCGELSQDIHKNVEIKRIILMRGASEDKEKGEKKSEGREYPPLAESEYYESSTRDECKSLVD